MKELERHLLTYLRPLHRAPLASISTVMLTSRLMTIAEESGATTSDNVRRSAHAFFAWCMARELIGRNPAMGVEKRKLQARTRVLDADEIRAVWQATGDGSDYSAIVRILLLTGLRANEVSDLRWSEILSDRIVLPAERTKNHREHAIPLTPQVVALLAHRARSGDFLFGRTSFSGFSGWSKSKSELDARSGIAKPWVHHDLRRTLATGMNELGIAPHVVEAVLNHISGARAGVAGVYNRAGYEGAIRHALATWEQHVMEIAEGRTTGDRVVPLRA